MNAPEDLSGGAAAQLPAPDAGNLNPGRRRLLQAGAGLASGLTIGFSLGIAAGARAATVGASGGAAAGAGPVASLPELAPNAFLRIDADDTVTVVSKHLEMGQGTFTGLATILADELDADWSRVRVEGAPADAKRFANFSFGAQGTGGSSSMANSWEQMRKAGATGRALLVTAAAHRWKVKESTVTVRDGVVMHAASGRSARFGELAADAALLPVPESVPLKDPSQFRLIGKVAPRKDSIAKGNGSAKYTQDVFLPGMLVAVVAHPPMFGARVQSFDAGKARAVKGVVDVVQIPTGVAVLARDTWSAKKGRDALSVVWDESGAFRMGSEEIFAKYRELAAHPGRVARKDGDCDQAFAGAARVMSAAFDFPYLAHAAMEPLNCVVRLSDGGCEVWNGEQLQTSDQYALAKLLGIAPEKVQLHMLYAGGSFGRRACTHADYVVEAASIAKAIGGRAPVKMVWMREDDMRAGYYRPLFHHTLQAAIDAKGQLTGWRHRLVGQSIMMGSAFEAFAVKDGIDNVSVEGASTLPYAIPNLTVELHTPTDIGVPVLWWRSVGSSHTAYSTETFLDEVAVATGQDPLDLRRALLRNEPRHLGVLELAAAKADWGTPLAAKAGERRGRGLAVHKSFNSYVAHVAEVTVQADGTVKVDRVVSAVDCGTAINPDNIRSQVEGAVGFALSSLSQEITLQGGRVVQGNFDGYPVLRLPDMPRVEVHLVASSAPPTGIGEPGVPPLAPAVANAIAAATGKRLRRLPFDTSVLKA